MWRTMVHGLGNLGMLGFPCLAPSIALIAASALVSLFVAPACSRAGEKAKAAVAKIKELGGQIIIKDRPDKIAGIGLHNKGKKNLTDEDIESIDFGVFSQVDMLVVFAQELTDRSLIQFAKIGKLRRIDIGPAKITDKGLAHFLGRQKDIYAATLRETLITDAVIPAFRKLEKLNDLGLIDSKITDKGVQEIAKLDKLGCLNLSGTELTDAGLAEIAKMPNLTILWISRTGVTDAGILKLGAIPNLAILEIRSTNVTDEGKDALQKVLPKLKIRN